MSRVVRLALRMFGAWWTVEFARGAVEGFSQRRPMRVEDAAVSAGQARRPWPLAA